MVDTRTHEDRREIAREAFTALPHGGRMANRLRITCGQGHHIADVYETSAGMVYVAAIRGHGHGDRDRFDAPHGHHQFTHIYELLDTGDDALPAWCDCGKRTLSRRAVQDWVMGREGRVVID